MRVAEQQPYLDAVDSALLPLGFARPKRSQEWSRRVDRDRLWLHLNFGQLAVINPSVGVEYLDLRRRWRDLPGAVFGTLVMLSHQFDPPRSYSTSDSPSRIAADLLGVGLAATDRLRNREAVIASLLQPHASKWPTPSFSHRIRLLTILLASSDRLDEAKAFVRDVAADVEARDQILPPFGKFWSALEAMLAD
jgi:hypothetical protein